jgi:DNA-nicking Smr family endonuclease
VYPAMAHGHKGDGDDDEPSEREVTKNSNPTTSLGPLLRAAKLSSAVQPPARRPSRGIHVPQRVPRADPEMRAHELAARKRVAALVSGGLHFKIKRDAGRVRGQRGAGSAKVAGRLAGKSFSPEVTLDLRAQHGLDASELIASFVHAHHRRGVRQLTIVFDTVSDENATHSALEAVVTALTHGRAAALVRAFSSAHANLGGDSAIAVLLI